ncbi:hypothetical protein SBV1_2600011 [Verrucomicrobia bacterium]|nr:hypothetical protein SBV1_2600011 [Verrucomicrobiota bacterium]
MPQSIVGDPKHSGFRQTRRLISSELAAMNLNWHLPTYPVVSNKWLLPRLPSPSVLPVAQELAHRG